MWSDDEGVVYVAKLAAGFYGGRFERRLLVALHVEVCYYRRMR
jgi:hypothetical protein